MKWNGGLVNIFPSCPGRQTCNWGLSLLAFCPSFDPWACPRSKQVADLVGHGVDSRWQFNEERDQRSPPYTWKPVCWVLKQFFSRPLLKTLIFILGLCYLDCKRVRAHTCTPTMLMLRALATQTLSCILCHYLVFVSKVDHLGYVPLITAIICYVPVNIWSAIYGSKISVLSSATNQLVFSKYIYHF